MRYDSKYSKPARQSADFANTENALIDLNIPEMQAAQGYIPTFLNEHMMIMSLICNPNTAGNNALVVAIQAIRLNVSLITDNEIRTELWQWYENEVTKRMTERTAANKETLSNDDKIQLQYDVAIVLLGKTMDYAGRHLSKPLEIGTE